MDGQDLAGLDDAAADALALVETMSGGDEPGFLCLIGAQQGRDALPLVLSLLTLLEQLADDTSADLGGWARSVRERWRAREAAEGP